MQQVDLATPPPVRMGVASKGRAVMAAHECKATAQRDQIVSKKRRRFEDVQSVSRPKKAKLEIVASQPSLALIPDSIALRVMALLDIPSLLCLSRVNRRYYHLHSDEYIWTDVDLTTVPKLNVQLVKKVIRDKLHPALWRLTLCSNAAECQRKPKLRPSITSSALDDIFRKCQRIRCIRLHNFDILQLPASCLLWSCQSLERVTFSHCITPFRWLEKVKPCWPSLTHFCLPYTSKTSDHDLLYLSTLKDIFLGLRYLSIRRCYRVGKVGLTSLCVSFPALLSLDISECSGVTSDCLLHIAQHMTRLQYLNIANCGNIDSADNADKLLFKLQNNCIHFRLLTVTYAQLHMDEVPSSECNTKRLNQLQITFKIKFVEAFIH